MKHIHFIIYSSYKMKITNYVTSTTMTLLSIIGTSILVISLPRCHRDGITKITTRFKVINEMKGNYWERVRSWMDVHMMIGYIPCTTEFVHVSLLSAALFGLVLCCFAAFFWLDAIFLPQKKKQLKELLFFDITLKRSILCNYLNLGANHHLAFYICCSNELTD